MNNAELLSAISDLMDQKLEEKLDRKLEPVICRIDQLEDNLVPRIENIEARVKCLEIDMENEVIPRLSLIEECYLDTYERYQNGIDRLDQMQQDIEVIKITVTAHSEAINKFNGPYLVK